MEVNKTIPLTQEEIARRTQAMMRKLNRSERVLEQAENTEEVDRIAIETLEKRYADLKMQNSNLSEKIAVAQAENDTAAKQQAKELDDLKARIAKALARAAKMG